MIRIRTLAILVVIAILAACGNDASDPNGFGFSALGGHGGRPEDPPGCKTDLECGEHQACFPLHGNHCMCKVGYYACGDQCFDTENDRSHCGSCAPCAAGELCDHGLCVAAGSQHGPRKSQGQRVFQPHHPMSIVQVYPPNPGPTNDPGPTVTVDPPANLTSVDPTTTCFDAAEAHPERSMNALFPGTPPALFSGYGSQQVNSASDWNAWSTSFLTLPNVYSGVSGGSDFWATTSGSTGLDYVSQVLVNGSNQLCFGIAATTPTHRQTNVWDFPAQCVTGSFDGGDGPSVAYDLSGKNLWGAQAGPIAGSELFIFENCGAGAPGGGACPLSHTISVLGARGHPVVAVDPCNHLGMLAYRVGSGASAQIILDFYSPSGTLVQELPMNSGVQAFDQTTACLGVNGFVPKCNSPSPTSCDESGQSGQCLRLISKVHIATQAVGGKCYAYLGYDSSRLSHTDFNTYFRSNLDVVDVTTSGLATQVNGYRDANDFVTFSSYGTVVAATDTATASNVYPAGWFWYSQFDHNTPGGDPCQTEHDGGVSINQFGTLDGITEVATSAGFFPSLRLAGYQGMGDYQGTVKRGLPQGILYPTWNEPVVMSGGSCFACEGQQYSMGILSTQLHVP